MNHYLTMSGILLNTALIVINRFVYKLPDKIQIPLCLVAIGLMIAGLIPSSTR